MSFHKVTMRGDSVVQQNQKRTEVAGKFCMDTEERNQETGKLLWPPGLLVDSVNKANVDSFQSRATVKE